MLTALQLLICHDPREDEKELKLKLETSLFFSTCEGNLTLILISWFDTKYSLSKTGPIKGTRSIEIEQFSKDCRKQ